MKMIRSIATFSLLLALTGGGRVYGQSASPLPPVQRIEAPGAAFISYLVRPNTTVEMKGTKKAPGALVKIRIRARRSHFRIDINRGNLQSLPGPWRFGLDYYTYVLWAVSPDGIPSNLGEIRYLKGRAEGLEVTTSKQAFWLMVTAEPNFAVFEPSPAVILVSRSQATVDTGGKGMPVQGNPFFRTSYGGYETRKAAGIPSNVPLYLLQAGKAVSLAEKAFRQTGVEIENEGNPAAALFRRAQMQLNRAQNMLRQDYPAGDIDFYGRTAAQLAESARALLFQATHDTILERLEREVTNAREKLTQQEKFMQAARGGLTAIQDNVSQLETALDRERTHTRGLESQLLSLREQVNRQQDQINSARGNARELRDYDKAFCGSLSRQLAPFGQLRQQNGFYILTLQSDRLFDSGKFGLKPSALLLLAKVSFLREQLFPGAPVRYEGHTDLQGSGGYNQWISEQRALAVYRFFLREEKAATGEPNRRAQLEQALQNVETMLDMDYNSVRRQPQRRKQWIDSLKGVVVGKGLTEPLVNRKGPNARNRRVTLTFANEQASILAALCEETGQ